MIKEETKNCQNCKQNFVIEPDDFAFYEKMKVLAPTWCPECRLIRRMIWRNERVLYKRQCDLCSEKIISVYPKEVTFPVYCPACWRSDKWDALSFGREYDFSKPFFAQFKELFNLVPRPAISQNGTNINTEYANIIQDVKNVYMSVSVIYGSENVYYSTNITSSKEVIDSLNVINGEIQYECVGSNKNYDCAYAFWSKNCVTSRFLFDCSDCQNCVGCVGLRGKSYYIFNQSYEKEVYYKKLKEFNLSSFLNQESFKKEFYDFVLKFPVRFARTINCVNSTGDEINNSRNANVAFNSMDLENVKYVVRCLGLKDSMDVTHKGNGQLTYEHALGGSSPGSNLIGIIYGMPAIDHVFYSDYCGSSSNLFGCIAIKGKSYVILNRLYTKGEYEELVPKIIEHMKQMPYTDALGRSYGYGEFFPPEFSPFAYNETYANEFFPKSKEQAELFGSKWKEITHGDYETTKEASDLPDDIKDVSDAITKETIRCASTGRAYRILPEELAFYRRMNLPLPRLHPDERHFIRFFKTKSLQTLAQKMSVRWREIRK